MSGSQPGGVRLGGVRTRVAGLVLVVTSVLYSVLAVLLFLVVVDTGRDAVARRADEVLDAMEAAVDAGRATVRVETADGIVADLRTGPVPEAGPGELVVARPVRLGDVDASLVATASLRSLNDGLRPLHRALWIGVPLAAVFTSLVAGLATRRALAPVDDITRLAARIGPDAAERVPEPATGDEIQRLARTVNEMLDRIAEGRRSKERFTSDAAHELRTPLMALQGELELAERGLGDDDSHRRMRAQAERLGRLVDDLVLLATLDEGRPAVRGPVALDELLRREAEAVAPDVEIDAPAIMVVGDAELLGRAVRNLVANARRHAAARVRVSIGHTPGSGSDDAVGTVTVHVDDDGPGLPESAAATVFERFRRLDDARSADAGGSGLGLAIVASVARAHDGEATASASPLGGARFTLRLPLVPEGQLDATTS